ncbi:MAG TPA: RecX family transcriptional regulator [Candidatus Saccharibacteria bacterium]|nr:RecX family transcriptional regulator [Candidatus Saccharibacteria bacterium]HRK93892.1 RecX family transcriptional regulator [Candidatus Saccharibacteria bacterium]
MKITAISVQAKNKDRVNVSVDGKYRFSLDIFQVGDLGVKVGKEYTEEELAELESESEFGKLYARALEYTLSRPHSAKEVRDYLWRKTRDTKVRNKKSGEITTREGVSETSVERTFNRLVERGYVNDEKFAKFWIENRNQTKGTSLRKLTMELRAKGVDQTIISELLQESSRSDESELQKVIAKKQRRYDDEQKFIQYLARQGFSYDDIKSALNESD